MVDVRIGFERSNFKVYVTLLGGSARCGSRTGGHCVRTRAAAAAASVPACPPPMTTTSHSDPSGTRPAAPSWPAPASSLGFKLSVEDPAIPRDLHGPSPRREEVNMHVGTLLAATNPAPAHRQSSRCALFAALPPSSLPLLGPHGRASARYLARGPDSHPAASRRATRRDATPRGAARTRMHLKTTEESLGSHARALILVAKRQLLDGS